jgi:hypothetical protein
VNRDEQAWWIVRAVGFNVLVFGVIEASYVIQYGMRVAALTGSVLSALNPRTAAAATPLYTWTLGWTIVRTALYGSAACYLLFGGRAAQRFVRRAIERSPAAPAAALPPAAAEEPTEAGPR